MVHAVGGDGLQAGEDDGVVVHGLAGLQGRPEAVVGPQFKEQLLPAGVVHPAGLGQAVVLQNIGDGEDEGEGVDGQGLRALGQAEDGAGLALLQHLKPAVPGEAVAGDGVGLPLVGVLPVLEPPDDGEQQGSVAGPDGGVGLPDVLGAPGVFH